MAALCSKLCHPEDKYVTYLTFNGERANKKRYERYEKKIMKINNSPLNFNVVFHWN
jgi:hypothetical protein